MEIVDVCEEIANLTLFKLDRAQVLDLKDLRAKIETIRYEFSSSSRNGRTRHLILLQPLVENRIFPLETLNVVITGTEYVRARRALTCIFNQTLFRSKTSPTTIHCVV